MVLATGSDQIRGRVYDDAKVGVAGATVTAVIRGNGRFANGSDALTTTTAADGAYTVAGCPIGTVVGITVGKPGWTTRTQPFVATAAVGPGPNVLDFGGTAAPDYAISDAPEVVAVTVSDDGTGVDPATAFTLRFSEPVNTTSLEQAVTFYAAGPATTGDATAWQLTGGGLPVGYDTPSDTVTGPASPIWDMRFLQAAWRDDGREVTLTFKTGFRLPADHLTKIAYALVLRGDVADASGHGRNGRLFRLQEARPSRNGYPFTIRKDQTSPRIIAVAATDRTGEKAPLPPADRIRITLSKPIVYQPLTLTGGATSLPDKGDTRSALNPANYRYITSAAFPQVFPFAANVKAGVTVLEGNTVLEIAPEADSDFARGNTVFVQMMATVTDPAGNPIDTTGSGNVGSAVVQ